MSSRGEKKVAGGSWNADKPQADVTNFSDVISGAGLPSFHDPEVVQTIRPTNECHIAPQPRRKSNLSR